MSKTEIPKQAVKALVSAKPAGLMNYVPPVRSLMNYLPKISALTSWVRPNIGGYLRQTLYEMYKGHQRDGNVAGEISGRRNWLDLFGSSLDPKTLKGKQQAISNLERNQTNAVKKQELKKKRAEREAYYRGLYRK